MAALLAAVSCAREEEAPQVTESSNPIVTFHASMGTKTTLEEDNTVGWAAGDRLTVFDAKGNKEEFVVKEAGSSFTFSSTGILGSGPYYAVAGYGEIVPSFDATSKKIAIDMPTTTDGTFGAADLIAATTSGTTFSFHHVYAIVKLSVAYDNVRSITFESKGIVGGNTKIGFASDGALDVSYASTGSSVTIEGITGAGTYYFAANPGSYSSFEIYLRCTDQYMKIDGGAFTARIGRMMNFGSLDNGTPATTAWQLVTDASALSVGDQVIIAASDESYALSTTQNNNNRGSAAIVKSSDKSVLDEPSSSVQIMELVKGTTDGTFAFSTGEGYLQASTGSTNYLRTTTTLAASSSWTISVGSSGVASIECGTKKLFYSSSNGVFNSYSSTSTNYKDVAIYKKVKNPGTGPQMQEISAFLDKTDLGVYSYDGTSDTVTPLYLYDIRNGAASEGSDQISVGSGSFRIQNLWEGLLASVQFSATSLVEGSSYSAATQLWGIEGQEEGASTRTFKVKKTTIEKAWIQEEGSSLALIISLK